MLGIERREKIIAKLNLERKVYVSELSKLFNVTEEIIRRDLEKLNCLIKKFDGHHKFYPSYIRLCKFSI